MKGPSKWAAAVVIVQQQLLSIDGNGLQDYERKLETSNSKCTSRQVPKGGEDEIKLTMICSRILLLIKNSGGLN